MEPLEPCARCGRNVLQLREGATRDAMRGSAPLCSVPGCPLVEKLLGFATPRLKGLELSGPSPPNVFVGRHGYPEVTMGPLLPATFESAPDLSDSPEDWKKLDIATILALRARLYRSKSPVRVDAAAASRALDASRELAMAARPVDAEVTLKKPLKVASPEAKVDAFAAPMGPSVDVVDARLLSNPSVPRKVDALVSDVHADAATAVNELYEGGIANHHIQRLLSVGLLGEGQRRRLVPTRWSITATDDILGKQMIEEVKAHGLVDAPRVHQADLFGNYFQILLLPRAWSYQMVEAWHEDGRWMVSHDEEGYRGRTAYVEQVAGAYYAARLSVLEHLRRIERQAAVFVYREITDEYWAPLGVWVIREAVKAAMDAKPLVFGDLDSAQRHMRRRSRSQEWVKIATLLHEARAQRTLREFGDAS